MTDNISSNEYIDKNLDRLLELGEAMPTMPEDLKEQIRSRLTKMTPESGEKRIFSFRWAVLPLAAAAALVFFLLVPWKGDLNGSITWADVKKQLEQVRSISYSAYGHIETADGKQIIASGKAYRKDPGLARTDIKVSASEVVGVKPGSSITVILRLEPGRADILQLNSEYHQAQLETWLFNDDNRRVPPFQPLINAVSKSWEILKKIAEDETNIIGDRVINGVPAIGFGFDGLPPEKMYLPDSSTVIEGTVTSGQLWVTRNDGTPVLAEVEGKVDVNSTFAQKVRCEYTDIQWNVPLEESLFNLDVPEGWRLNKKETIDYIGKKLAPGVTLNSYASGQESLITAEDVVGIVQAVETSYPGSNRPNEVKITVEVSHEAAQRLHRYADIHPDNFIRVNFNDQLNAALELDRKHTNRVSFYLSWLDLSLSEIEERYFTETSRISEKHE